LRIVVDIQKIVNEVRKIFTRTKVGKLAIGLLDRDVALEMALHTDRVALLRQELCRIDDRRVAIGEMRWIVAVAALAGDAVVREERHIVFIFCAVDRSLGVAGVTRKAARQRWQVHRNCPGLLERGRGIPYFLLRVPVDRRFEEKPIEGKKIRTAAMAGADEILQSPCAADSRIVDAFEAEHRAPAFRVDAVVNPRRRVLKVSGDEFIDSGAARLSHRGKRIRIGDFSMTFLAGGVARLDFLDGGSLFRRSNLLCLLRHEWKRGQR
jgi:hypothetical protein